ncbi:BsuPI-related putative proteinase inhibitor [Bacillus sp. B15-48]|uniref:BsuPI-related putative proteinase inhibitor n=1 Tax=Bacillus sp. B15-48 TaxID=1548601 RepID=UPI00193F814C|nr:BsuPI-related putative proteinase inhibitor [Bacillus sp. B15-48]
MTKRKWLGMVLSMLIFGLMSGCGTGVGTGGTLDEQNKNEHQKQLQPEIEIIEKTDEMFIKYTVKNRTGEDVKLTFPSGLQADYIIYDENDKKIMQYSDDIFSTQAIQEVTLTNNEALENTFTIPNLYVGSFKIEVFLTAQEDQAKVVSNLLASNSN